MAGTCQTYIGHTVSIKRLHRIRLRTMQACIGASRDNVTLASIGMSLAALGCTLRQCSCVCVCVFVCVCVCVCVMCRLAFQGMLTAEFQGAAVPCTGTQSALLDTFQSLLPNLLPHLQPQLTAAAAAARAAGAAAAGAANRSTSAARSLRTLLSSTVQHSNADTVPQQGISLGLSAMTSPLHALMSSMAHNSDNVTDAYTVGGRSLLHTQPPAPLSAAMSGPRLGSPAGISAGLSSAAAAVAGGSGSDAGCWVQGDTVLRALNVGSSAANQLIGLCVYYTGLLVLTWLCMVMLARRRSRQAHT